MMFIKVLAFIWPVIFFSQNNIDDLLNSESELAKKILSQKINVNTINYDLKYHKLDINLDPDEAFISGTITSHFLALDDLTQITFDLSDNMQVENVTHLSTNTNLNYTQNSDDELVIELAQLQSQGTIDSLSVTYSGNPVSSGFGSFEQSYHNGDPIVWTLSEPYGAKGWWPCKQDLNDKIDSIDVYINTPVYNSDNEEYISASNGLEISQTYNDNFKITHFRHNYPIPAYLIAVAVTNYEIYSHEVSNNGNPFEIVNYVYPEDFSTAQEQTLVTVDIMDFFTEKFEEYPFSNEKYGHAQFGWGVGMEHTTVSFMGNFSRGLIAHELAHQWFGNSATEKDWSHLWLSEGFATYLTNIYIEQNKGKQAFKEQLKKDRKRIVSFEKRYRHPIVDQSYKNLMDLLNPNSYQKGGWVLHMLRGEIGEELFHEAIRAYYQKYQLSNADSKDFQNVVEEISGTDLDWFFKQWLHTAGHPKLKIDANIENRKLALHVHQKENIFTFPFKIEIHCTEGPTIKRTLHVSQASTQKDIITSYPIKFVVFDPEVELLFERVK